MDCHLHTFHKDWEFQSQHFRGFSLRGWLCFHLNLKKNCKMPPTGSDDLGEEAPDCFKEFPNLKVIVDCTELFAETPSSLASHKQFHSNYKHHSTVKFLVALAVQSHLFLTCLVIVLQTRLSRRNPEILCRG